MLEERISTIKENFQAIEELSIYPKDGRSNVQFSPETPEFVKAVVNQAPLPFETMYLDAEGQSFLFNASSNHLICVKYNKSISFNKILLEHNLKELNQAL